MKTIEVKTRKQALTFTKSERAFQEKIERYQLANAAANYSTDARIDRATDYFLKLKNRELKMSKANIKSLATWNGLRSLFIDLGLVKMTEKEFEFEAEFAINRDLKQGRFGKITKEQETVLIEYHTNRAHAQWEQVESIKICLTEKGLLTGKDAYDLKKLEKIAAKKEKEEETKPAGLVQHIAPESKLAEKVA